MWSEHAAVVVTALLLLGMMLITLSSGTRNPLAVTLPLHRCFVDSRLIRGVDRQWRFACRIKAEHQLRQSARKTRTMLFWMADRWHVLAGDSLAVVLLDETDPHAVCMQFPEEGCHPLTWEPTAEERARFTQENTTTTTTTVVVADPQARELSADRGALVLDSIDLNQNIQGFGTLKEALLVAKPYDATSPEADYIVGGSTAHPMYYVVHTRNNNLTDGTTPISVGGGPPDSRVWVRV